MARPGSPEWLAGIAALRERWDRLQERTGGRGGVVDDVGERLRMCYRGDPDLNSSWDIWGLDGPAHSPRNALPNVELARASQLIRARHSGRVGNGARHSGRVGNGVSGGH